MLWLLIQSFDGGQRALVEAPPPALHYMDDLEAAVPATEAASAEVAARQTEGWQQVPLPVEVGAGCMQSASLTTAWGAAAKAGFAAFLCCHRVI